MYLTSWFPQHVKAAIMPFHKLFGVLLYGLQVATIGAGILEKQTFLQAAGLDRFSSASMIVNSAGMMFVITAISVFVLLLLKYIPHLDQSLPSSSSSPNTPGVFYTPQ
jgi:hypothetical protein